MQKFDEKNLSYWGLVCLLAFSPLIRGGHQIWAALLITLGIGLLLTLNLILNVWKGLPTWVWDPRDLLFLVSLFWVLIGLGRSSAPPDSFISFLILLGCVGFFLLARTMSFIGLTIQLAIAVSATGGALVLMGLLQVLGYLAHGWWDPPQFMASTFINHNHLAAYLELVFPISCLLWLAAPLKPIKRFILAISSALMAIGILLSCSRGAWLSLATSTVIVFGWLAIQQSLIIWDWRKTAIAIASFLAIGFLVSQPPIFDRAMSLLNAPNDLGVQTRQAIWRGTWTLIKENPLFGRGVGSFLFAFPPYRPAGLYWLINYAHNEYLQVVAELGLVGLALVVGSGTLVLWRMAQLVLLSQTPWKRALGIGGLIGMGSLAIHSLVDFPWHIPAVAFEASTLAGLVTGIVYRADPHPLRRVHLSFVNSRSKALPWITTSFLVAGFLTASWPLVSLIVADAWAFQGDLKRAVHLAPFRAVYHEQLGERLNQLGWQSRGEERRLYFKQAQEAYQKALALVPHNARDAHALGEILKARGDLQEADRWLHEAISGDPQNPLYWKHWAELKLIRGQANEATAAFRRATELAKPYNFFPNLFEALDNPEYFAQQGESALLLGQQDFAETSFKIAQALDRNHPGAKVGLALCAFNRGDSKTARHLMASVHDPVLRAKWYAGLAQRYLDEEGGQGKAEATLETSLRLDPNNVLARHLELVLAKARHDDLHYVQAMAQILSLNHPPVFPRSDKRDKPLVVWEPERGAYKEGQKTKDGWALFTNGSIHQRFFIPPGTVRFTVTASGTKAKGVGPTLELFWNAHLLLVTEVDSEIGETYTIETEVRPGESLLTVNFPNDFNDRLAHQDRNLKLEKITASWEST